MYLSKLWKVKGCNKFTFFKRGVAGKTTGNGRPQRGGTAREWRTTRRCTGEERSSGVREGEKERPSGWERERNEKRWPFGRLNRAWAYPAMIHGGVHVSTGHPTGPCSGHVAGSTPPPCMAGFSVCCPAMHGGGAKQPRFEISFLTGLNLKFVFKMG